MPEYPIYEYILKEAARTLEGALNIQDALGKFLGESNTQYTPTIQYKELYQVVLDCQPDCVTVESTQ